MRKTTCIQLKALLIWEEMESQAVVVMYEPAESNNMTGKLRKMLVTTNYIIATKLLKYLQSGFLIAALQSGTFGLVSIRGTISQHPLF